MRTSDIRERGQIERDERSSLWSSFFIGTLSHVDRYLLSFCFPQVSSGFILFCQETAMFGWVVRSSSSLLLAFIIT
jgi:hypothetical protein